VKSRRGRHGGYLLAKKPDEITIGNVIRLIDGSIAPMGCVSGNDYISCLLDPHCVIRQVFMDVRERICEIVDNTTFMDLRNRTIAAQEIPQITPKDDCRLTIADSSAETA